MTFAVWTAWLVLTASDAGTATPAKKDQSALRQRAQEIIQRGVASDDAPTRADALEALGMSQLKNAQQALLAALQDPQGQIRFSAARGLRYLGPTKAALQLSDAWDKEEGWAVKKELALTIAAMGLKDMLPALKKEAAKTALHPELKTALGWALSDMGDPEGQKLLASAGNPPRKTQAKPGADRWSRKVLLGATEGDRVLAARTLAEVGAADDVPLLQQQLDAKDAKLQMWAAAALLRLTR